MTVESIKIAERSSENGILLKTDPSVYRIVLSDGALFSFKADYLPPECPLDQAYVPGRELSPDEVEALYFAASCYRTERAALRLTARAEQHSFGISRKLEQRGHTAPCVRAVVARLSSAGIVNDSRYASLWIQARLVRPSGATPRSLTESLRRRGLDRETVQTALAAALEGEAEADLLRACLEKNRRRPSLRFRSVGEGRLRQALRHEGFSPEVLDRFREEGLL
jgi:regulatory protein